jgi:NAD(P)-dependent dehydrogenase (short-subunit alcohol dehydrogenase family)
MRAVITGGRGFLGAATARAFIAAGHAVVSIDHATTPAPDWLDSIGGVDLGDADAAQRALDEAVARLGGVDVLVNIAGGFAFEHVTGAADVWDRMFATNFRSCLHMCRAAAPVLAAGGAIVNVGAAARAAPGKGPYLASKAAVMRLTEVLAAELHERVRVNAILPLTIDTPANRSDMPQADFSKWTSPDAIAEVVLFLASRASRAINGALIEVSAGTR